MKKVAQPKSLMYVNRMIMQPKVVLLVEDDDCVREVVADLLTASNLSVVQAADAAQALKVLREAPHLIDLLFTDVRMPGEMDGIMLAHYVTATWPMMPILITSGHMSRSNSDIPPKSQFLPKPYTLAQLQRVIGTLTQPCREDVASISMECSLPDIRTRLDRP